MLRRATLLGCVAACTPFAPSGVGVDGITPSSAKTTDTVSVQITGSFHRSLTTDLDRGTTGAAAVTASIGTMPLEDLVWRDDLLEATLSAGLSVGTYDVNVTIGGGIATLPGGFTVTGPDVVVLGAFGTPQRLDVLNTVGNEDDPSLTADLLELFFERDAEVWVSTRASISDPWSSPTLVTELSTGAETTPAISPDGLTIFVASSRTGGAGLMDLYQSTRATRTSPWTTPVQVTELATAQDESFGQLSPDGLVLHFTRAYDLYRTQRAAIGQLWATPVRVDRADVPASEYAAWFDVTETVMFHVGDYMNPAGEDDLWLRTRAKIGDPFGLPVKLVELSVPGYDDEDPWLSPDLRLMVFSSDRPGIGSNDIYFATR